MSNELNDMSDMEATDTDDLSHQLEYLNLRLRNVEHFPLSPGQTLWVVLSQTIFAAYGFFTLLALGLLWTLEGPSEAFATAKLFTHLAIATLMLLAMMIALMNGIERLLARR
jgi:hypothetical protein